MSEHRLTDRQLVRLCAEQHLTRLELMMAQILLGVNGAESALRFVADVVADRDKTRGTKEMASDNHLHRRAIVVDT